MNKSPCGCFNLFTDSERVDSKLSDNVKHKEIVIITNKEKIKQLPIVLEKFKCYE